MTEKLSQYRGKYKYVPVLLVIFGLIFVRYCYYGFEYFLQLDDYIQYHNYTAYNQDIFGLMNKLGMLASRPLAGLSDIFIWSKFYSCMIAAVAIISGMYAVSAVLFHKVFSKHFGTGFVFFVIYALLPLGFEGTYWVSASSRIVVGMFFAAVALSFFDAWCDKGGKWSLVLFILTQFIGFCYYEQIILLSGGATMVIMLCYAKQNPHRAAAGFIMFLSAAIYLVITRLAPTGVYGERTELFLPWQTGYYEHCFLSASKQMTDVFINGNIATFGKGFIRGLKLLITDPNILYMLVVLLLCAGLFVITKSASREKIKFFPELIAGLFLTIAPLLLFFVLKSPWFGARNAVCSFLGLALVIDALTDLIFGRFSKGGIIEAGIVSVLALVCCISAVSEIHDYRQITMADTAVSRAVSKALVDEGLDGQESVWILNVDASYLEDANFYLHEHGYGVTSSDWALTGAVATASGRGDIPDLFPISKYRHFPASEEEIASAAALMYKDGSCFRAFLEKGEGDFWEVKDDTGITQGILRLKDEGFFLELE